MAEPKELTSLEEFVFEAPLYATFRLSDDMHVKGALIGQRYATLEGFCPTCEKERVFSCSGSTKSNNQTSLQWDNFARDRELTSHMFIVRCTKGCGQKIRVFCDITKTKIRKIGQDPSLADIGGKDAKKYRGAIEKQDVAELHRAMGLASANVGVGSFVYLRRIFERLIYSRFEDFKDAEGWDEIAFKKARMDEKVGMLKTHIPDFLYEHRKIYGLLSKGIHELSEEECLGAFPWLKKSIFFILDEDLRKKEELAQKAEIAAALAAFKT